MKNHYLSEYLKLKCSGQLQGLFSMSANPYKEITESMGAWINMREYINPKDENHSYFFIGDGSLCLTCALFAFMTKGKCFSVDPVINVKKVMEWSEREQANRFIAYKQKYQDIGMSKTVTGYDLILVHAHVKLEELADYFPNWRYLYTNPCCNLLDQTFSVQYQQENAVSVLKTGYDKSNLSPKNMVFIYKNNKWRSQDDLP